MSKFTFELSTELERVRRRLLVAGGRSRKEDENSEKGS